jgi:hypothetical protein
MSAPTWVGSLAQNVSLLISLAALGLGVLNYRRTSRIKSLDLRLELRKAVADVDREVQALPALIDQGRGSRAAVRAARGMANTGAMEAFGKECGADHAVVAQMRGERAAGPINYQKLTTSELEDKLVEVHGLQARVQSLKEKYRAGIAADDKEREFIRDQAHRRTEG